MEQTNLLNEFAEPSLVSASTGQRLANYLLDIIAFYGLIFIVGIFGVFGSNSSDVENNIGVIYLVAFTVIFGYYTILEGSRGKTLGKLVTKTKVLREDGLPISYGQAFMRTLCRMVPFEFISAFTGSQMWHDRWTKTIVVKDV
jgi:uncharacterized RDD family membrane protein YckC